LHFAEHVKQEIAISCGEDSWLEATITSLHL